MKEPRPPEENRTLTIRLNEQESELLERLARQTGASRDDAALSIMRKRLDRLAWRRPGLTINRLTETLN